LHGSETAEGVDCFRGAALAKVSGASAVFFVRHFERSESMRPLHAVLMSLGLTLVLTVGLSSRRLTAQDQRG
jgi:hypothetical protein